MTSALPTLNALLNAASALLATAGFLLIRHGRRGGHRLAMLAAVGLSSAFVDALHRETMRTVRLIRILRDDAIYSDRDIELC